jgi:hypothetical protein
VREEGFPTHNSQSPTTMTTPVVFLSYSHDSAEHRDRVLALSERLRQDGVETILDRYVNGTPPEKWPRWMLNGIECSTHVLCICTPTYYRRFRGHEIPGAGKGVDWEGAIITQEIYDSRNHGTKFIPVMFAGAAEGHIPEPLRGATHYHLEEGYEALYDAILGQAGAEPAPLGQLRIKPRVGSVAGSATAIPAAKDVPDPSPEPTEEDLAAVFTQTIDAIDHALNSAPAVAKFLGPSAPAVERLAIQKGNQWEVHSRYRSGGEDVCPVLTSIWARRSSFTAPRHEWDALEQIVGGVLVLGVNPRWVWQQRLTYSAQAVLHPKRSGEVNIETGKAQFLSLITTALSGGCVRLDRVFSLCDPKRVPDIASVTPGITSADRLADMKRHFIRFVLGPSDELDVEALEGDDLNTFFQRVRQLLRIANKVDRDPYLAAGPHLTKLASEVKAHLELSDLYLFVPDVSGDESDLMTDPVIALSLAQRIRKFIESQRPNI